MTQNNLRTFLSLFAVIFLISHPECGAASNYTDDYVIEDAVQIQVLDDKLLAFRDSRSTAVFALNLNERVLEFRSTGLVGAAVTSNRMLAVSSTSDRWVDQPIKLSEAGSVQISLSHRLVLMISSHRALAFDGLQNRFIQSVLRIVEQVVEYKTSRNLALIVTNKRILGYAAGGSGFVDLDFKLRETFQSLNLTAKLATVETSERLLVFQAHSGSWSEQPRPVRN